jgi:hypothetical protein
MAEYSGSTSKLVSSSYLFRTLQNFYTKIKGLLTNKVDKDEDGNISVNGATFSNTVTIQSDDLNGHYNGLLVGDDCYIGDCNIENTIGLMGKTDNTLAYVKFGTDGKKLGFNGSCLIYDDSVVVTEKIGVSPCTKQINSTGFGDTCMTYYQTNSEFYGNTGWTHYIICNHGNGSSYYNYTIGLPFWGTPMYKRQTGSTDDTSNWQTFYTTENITFGTSDLVAGSSALSTGHIYLQYE